MFRKEYAAVLFLLIATSTLSLACFVRNCPVGGKRSFATPLFNECLRCGPADVGVCVSADVCCLPFVGCQSDAASVERCSLENKSPLPCTVKGPRCGQTGICVTEGVCCSGDAYEDCVNTSECFSFIIGSDN